jgi:RNA polymerase sigma-70 factor (ECF subfamily)
MIQTEQELIDKAKGADRQAFDELVRQNKDKMFALTYRMTGDRETALDLVQETFLTAYRELTNFRGESSFSSWLYRIASNKTINFLRRKKLLSFVPLANMGSSEPSYELSDNIDNSAISSAASGAIKALPPNQRLVFNLRFYEEMSFPEIARILNKHESTVKTNYQKAVEKLQKSMKQYR